MVLSDGLLSPAHGLFRPVALDRLVAHYLSQPLDITVEIEDDSPSVEFDIVSLLLMLESRLCGRRIAVPLLLLFRSDSSSLGFSSGFDRCFGLLEEMRLSQFRLYLILNKRHHSCRIDPSRVAVVELDQGSNRAEDI